MTLAAMVFRHSSQSVFVISERKHRKWTKMFSHVYGCVTNNNEFWIGLLDLLTPSLYSLS
jgi:hypothetical protein